MEAGSGDGRTPTIIDGIKFFETAHIGAIVYVPIYYFPKINTFCAGGGVFRRKEDIIPRCKGIAEMFDGEVAVYECNIIDWTDKDKKGGKNEG